VKFMGRAARMARHHKRAKSQGELNLVSMIDMLTVLVFFLLVYTTNEVEILPSAKDVQLPQSIAEATAREAVVVVVSETEILMNGESLGKISDILKSKELIIPKLKTALENEVKRSVLADAELTEEQRIASREVTIMADKEIPYQLLKRVMATSTAADYGQLSLAVLQKASEARLATVARN
jgi:biopolymer transport protein TolR